MKIAINGFGRIGRTILRIALSRKIEVVAINDLQPIEQAAYLFKYDSSYGPYQGEVSSKSNELIIDKKKIKFFSESDPSKLPWKDLGVDAVIESTGAFTKREGASLHLKAGAKHVLISAPAKQPDITVVIGVNHKLLKKSHQIISVASCTTNCLAPVVKVLNDSFGIKDGFMTTVHAYTNDQVLHDQNHKSRRRGRAAAVNIIPTSTGAAETVAEVIPELKGHLTGLALRVPVPVGSVTDFVAELKKPFDIQKVNEAIKKASQKDLKGILQYTEDEIVSSDIIGNSHSSIFDGKSTMQIGNMVKILSWYDNEFGYSNRVVDVVQMLK